MNDEIIEVEKQRQEIMAPLAFQHFLHTLKFEDQEFGVLCKQSQTYSTNQIP